MMDTSELRYAKLVYLLWAADPSQSLKKSDLFVKGFRLKLSCDAIFAFLGANYVKEDGYKRTPTCEGSATHIQSLLLLLCVQRLNTLDEAYDCSSQSEV
jgi:hypothetical protein